MDSNITFRIDSNVKKEMAAICNELGMTTSTAFNLFANAFVREKGMPFPVKVQIPEKKITQQEMMADTDQFLSEFATDYKRMAE